MTNKPRLDRLSVLLGGLAPKVEVVHPDISMGAISFEATSELLLHIHVITQGQICLSLLRTASTLISAPTIVICRADVAHTLQIEESQTHSILLSAKVFLDGPVASLFLKEFAEPRIVNLDDANSSLNHIVSLLSSELLEERCGQPALLGRAGDILFIGLLRHLVANSRTTGGLFKGLADPRIARALVAMHASPQKNWTLDSLAEEAGMSRTSFSTKFNEIMNIPPGNYLRKLRLLIANKSVESGLGMKKAAKDSGYASPSTLSRALSRDVKIDANPSHIKIFDIDAGATKSNGRGRSRRFS